MSSESGKSNTTSLVEKVAMENHKTRNQEGENGLQPGLLVLLGAGASVPHISGVRALTDSLLVWSDFRPPEHNTPPDPFSLTALAPLLPRGASDKRPPFFAHLKEILSEGRGDGGRDLTFEHLIHACDELAHVIQNEPDPKDGSRWMLEPFFQLRDKVTSWGAKHVPSGMISLAEEARYHILKIVANQCTGTTDSNKVYLGIKSLADRYILKIHSLNYDDLIFHTGLDYYTGFEGAAGMFSPRYPWPERVHSLAQLHGSVRWGWNDSGELKAFSSAAEAMLHWKSRAHQQSLMDGQALPTGPMLTGLRKADLILERPYGTYFHVFRHHLLTTRHWLIIGYGFGDPHVNRALQQAWANWTQRGSLARAVVIDYMTSSSRNLKPLDIEPTGWKKLHSLLEPVFFRGNDKFDLLDENLYLRGVRPVPERGLIKLDSNHRLAVQLDGGIESMTTGFNEIAEFFSS
jgi:hypothetical protein